MRSISKRSITSGFVNIPIVVYAAEQGLCFKQFRKTEAHRSMLNDDDAEERQRERDTEHTLRNTLQAQTFLIASLERERDTLKSEIAAIAPRHASDR